ncbi:iron-siderophore ABC transporter substrate-binding protein [Paenibacillus sp. LHD-38]|uniref:ABC transporter substrate-binding protein n=1 Tax=Paenibacillus sp. LHD-38 TaxID=3072143 RepID=UPI00280D8FC1|nr:iron-siderophore ABC transporter substrate-binding protein [Paenibacillus sp. LHD-38]MDQ8737681.1 iron-siderophore ABC transporter substrate-binding protein [Paenibacillus sp. LHD-38]
MKRFKLLLVLMLSIAIAGCGTNGSNESNGAANNGGAAGAAETETPAAANNDAAGTSRTIEHAMGTVTLEKKPERVVVLFNGMVDITVALGVKPVGAVESWDQKPWYEFLRDKMTGVENLGDENQPNIEAIIALKPDLIIGTKTRDEKIYPQLEAIAPTIITEEVFDWKENMKLSAQALYMEEEADKLLADWDQRVADFKQKAGDRLASTEASVIRFEKDGSARFYATGFAGTIFKELGIGRPQAQIVEGKAVVNITSKEQMEQLDGDYIFDITQIKEDEPSRAAAQTEWTSHPLWASLKGVKNGKYMKVDVVTWNLSAGVLAANSMLDDLYEYFELK